MPDHSVEVTADAVIANLAMENLGLKGLLALANDKNNELRLSIEKLEEDLKISVPLSLIASFVEQQIKTGKVPIPKYLTSRSKGLTEVSCKSHMVSFRSNSMFAKVVFSFPGSGDYDVNYCLALVPDKSNESVIYPDFHLEYETSKPVKKKVKKAKVEVSEVKQVLPKGQQAFKNACAKM